MQKICVILMMLLTTKMAAQFYPIQVDTNNATTNLGHISKTSFNTFTNKASSTATFTINGTNCALGSSSTVTAAASTLTGTILNSTVLQSSLVSAGTFTNAVWNATTIGPTFGGTGITTYTTGDLIYGSATNTLSKLTIGSTGQVLSVSAGLPSWITPTYTAALSFTSPLSLTGNVVSMPAATGSVNGYLTSTDWTTFNNKASSAATFTINGTNMALGTNSTVTAAAGTLTGTTLNSTVVQSSLVSAGTFTNAAWNATKIGLAYGGTNSDLSASGAVGDIIQGATSTTFSRLAAGAAGTILRSAGTGSLTAYSTATYPNTVTAGQILYGTGTNAIGGNTRMTYTAGTFSITANGDVDSYATSQSSNVQGNYYSLYDDAGKMAFFGQYGTSYAGNYGGTSIGFANTGTFRRNGTAAAQRVEFIAAEGYAACLVTATSTNIGWSQWPAGLKIDQLANLHTTGTYALDVRNGDIGIGTAGKSLRIKTGTGGFAGQIALVSGVATITITGLATTDFAFAQLATFSGALTGVKYTATCTANTLTITSITAAGITDTNDTSTLNYFIIRPF